MTELAFGLILRRFDKLTDLIHDQNYLSCKFCWLVATDKANFKVITYNCNIIIYNHNHSKMQVQTV